MSQQRRQPKDKNRIVRELKQSRAEAAADIPSATRRQHEIENFFNAAVKLTPTQLHCDLRRTCENLLTADTSDFSSRSTSIFITPESISQFLRQLLCNGLIDAVMSNLANDHADAKGISRGDVNLVPDLSVIWPVIRYVLANPNECQRWGWLETAMLSAETYATDRDEAARLLADYIRSDSLPAQIVSKMCPNAIELAERQKSNAEARHVETASAWCLANFVRNSAAFAALGLSQLAPQTPGLVEVLIDGLSHDWFVSLAINDREIGGAGMAAEALARLGPQAQKALTILRETALSDQYWLSANDRRLAFEAYVVLCADESATRALFNEVEAKKKLFDQQSKVCQVGEK